MKALSLFTGIGGFDKGFEHAGFELVGMCEADPWCRAVLKRHWPDVPLRNDVCGLNGADYPDCDVVMGGFPCQDLSVAGKRGGLRGARSGLFFEVARIVGEIRKVSADEYPKFVVLENVPGLLSSHGGRDFAALLAEMAKLGALDISWRTLDSRHFGVPQRRRRVFVVADFRGKRAGQVLFEPQSVCRNTQAGRAAGQDVAACVTAGTGRRYDPETETLISVARGTYGFVSSYKRRGGFGWSEAVNAAHTLKAEGGAHQGGPEKIPLVVEPRAYGLYPDETLKVQTETSPTLRAPTSGGNHAAVAYARTGHGEYREGAGTLCASRGDVGGGSETLLAFDARASSSRSMNPAPLSPPLEAQQKIAVCFDDPRRYDMRFHGGGEHGDLHPTLAATNPRQVVVFNPSQEGAALGTRDGLASTLTSSMGHHGHSSPRGDGSDNLAVTPYAVRRLTPVECERLQGFPDHHTAFTAGGQPIADTHRYRMCGNAVTVPVAAFIAERLAVLDA